MAQPLTESDIIFPHLSNTPNFSTTLSSLKRSALSITNRLNSISKDSDFVSSVAASYDSPLVANERCGSWYIPLDLKAASVYFKSTDGHMGEWAFSLRRLNLQLLDVVSQHGGCVIVDSTRRGKSMPDALSKTVPFWCCVMNRAIFGAEMKGDDALNLFTPPAAVSESENAQMERRVDGFVQQFLDICKPNIPSLRAKLQKPLRPLWVTQTSTLPLSAPAFPAFHPIILCTASRRVRGAEASEGGYIQGAADDHEAWSCGLTPSLFWRHKAALLRTNEEDLPAEIAQLVSQDRSSGGGEAVPTLIKPTTTLFVSASQNADFASFDTVISCTPEPLPHAALQQARVKAYLHLPCASGKLGSRDLRTHLPALRLLCSPNTSPAAAAQRTLVVCPTGTDLAVGAAVAYLVFFADDAGAVDLRRAREAARVDKTLIKQRLSWVTTSNPALNPSRATLQSVNAVLMSAPAAAGGTQAVVRDPALCDGGWAVVSPASRVETRRAVDVDDITSPSSQVETPGVVNVDANTSSQSGATPPTESPGAVNMDDITSPSSQVETPAATSTTTSSPSSPSSPSSHPFPTPTPTHTTLFRALPSSWKFTRTLTSALPTHPSGTVTGTATFTPSSPTSLLYHESGSFTTDGGLQFAVQRGYVYALRDDGGGLAIHFLPSPGSASDGEDEETMGSLFLELGPLGASTGEGEAEAGMYEAQNREVHLCGEDVYAARWRFGGGMLMRGEEEEEGRRRRGGNGDRDGDGEWWEVRYRVSGPRKEYVSWTRYERVV